jgi:hypothetical protein
MGLVKTRGKASSTFCDFYQAYERKNYCSLGETEMVSQRGGRVPRHKATGEPEGQIEGFFKTVKHCFSLHRFGQKTLLGVYRWLILSLVSYLLAPKGLFASRYF